MDYGRYKLLEIQAGYIKVGDKLFDFGTRQFQVVKMIEKSEDSIYVDFGESGEYFRIDDDLIMLIDLKEIPVVDYIDNEVITSYLDK